MNNIETAIKDIIREKLENGLVEKIVSEQLEKGISKAVEDIFSSWGSGTKTIKSKIESVMIPYLEGYDYSEYIVKLDSVLCEILKNCTPDNRKMLENFKKLTIVEERKEVRASKLFEIWCDYVAKRVETSGLEIDYDDSPTYQPVEVSGNFMEGERPIWSSHNDGRLIFECEHDESMNFEICLHCWDDSINEGWTIANKTVHDISSLRYLNDMEILLMKLVQNGANVIIDKEYLDAYVCPEAEPEVSWS